MKRRVLLALFFLGLVGIVSASYCCERTNNGAWCVNEDEANCNANYNMAPTSCETTSYCKLGTCYDSKEGICMGNTPQRSCVDSGGTWTDKEPSQVAQCSLGCCIIAEQAAFVSLVRCKRLSTLFGVENNYMAEVNDEVTCIAMANSQDVGACVYQEAFENVCEFTTRGECGATEVVEILNDTNATNTNDLEITTGKAFYKDYLCSAEELGTTCARQASTMCWEGDVYWVDSCGNRENVYSKDEDRSWNNGRVLEADSVCSAATGDNVNCGNCDYMKGSRCAEYDGLVGGPSKGDYYCQTTKCVDRNGNKRLNGESWCTGDSVSGNGLDRAGARYYREICVDGEVKVEACADFRNEICIEDSIGSFSVSGCRVNRWHDCVLQTEEDDCTNQDKRDCIWIESIEGLNFNAVANPGVGTTGGNGTFSNPTSDTAFSNPTSDTNTVATTTSETTSAAATTDTTEADTTSETTTTGTGSVIAPITGNSIFDNSDDELDPSTTTNRLNGTCVPNYPPGLKFWDASANSVCKMMTANCTVEYEKGLLDDDWEIVEGEDCLETEWAFSANKICTALGDCGGYVNYLDEYTDDGYSWKLNSGSTATRQYL